MQAHLQVQCPHVKDCSQLILIDAELDLGDNSQDKKDDFPPISLPETVGDGMNGMWNCREMNEESKNVLFLYVFFSGLLTSREYFILT